MGKTAIAEIQFADYIFPAFDQLVNGTYYTFSDHTFLLISCMIVNHISSHVMTYQRQQNFGIVLAISLTVVV